MSNKKHIDRLFQEKFKDFEAAPDPKVWESIQNELAPKKEKKRIIPIWYKYAGVAVLLLLFLTVGISTFNSASDTTNAIVDGESPAGTAGSESLKNNDAITIGESNAVVSSTENNTAHTNEIVKDVEQASNKNEAIVSTPTATTTNSNKNETTATATNAVVSKSYKTTKRNTASESIASQKTNSAIIANIGSYSKNGATSNKNKTQNITKEATRSNNIIASTNTNPHDGDAVISNSNVNKKEDQENAINKAINDVKNDSFSIAQSPKTNENEAAASTIAKDSIVKTTSIEEAIAEVNTTEKEKKKKEEPYSNNKWSVNANVAPVYYNTLGKGSPIDAQFVNNNKSGDINTSYGINVGYAINDKLKVRSGINSLNVGYNTNNVVVYKSVANSGRDAIALANLEASVLNSGDSNITVISAETISTNQFETIITDENMVSLNQQISYLEIPVELEYALINKRFGVNIVGGMSTFVLGSNEVSTQLNGVPARIGEATNINDLSFSTNIGLGINYGFSKAVNINLEPTFKYQINAFENVDGNFNPFLIGVYTGLSYKF